MKEAIYLGQESRDHSLLERGRLDRQASVL